jgi:thioredoxin reductase
VGSGPAGIGVALGLARGKVGGVALIERAAEPGGVPAKYVAKRGGVPTFVVWKKGRVLYGEDYVDSLMRKLAKTGTELWLESQVTQALREPKILTVVGPDRGKVDVTADVVVLACGAREKSLAQRGWLAGHRPAGVFYTMQLLDLLDGDGCLPMSQPVVLGSDLIAYSAAAKLRSHGAGNATLIDRSFHPAATLLERLYFRRWCKPEWNGVREKAEISGSSRVDAICLDGENKLGSDGVVASGSLVPNSELAVEAGLGVLMPSWRPVMRGGYQLSHAGWFVAGNMMGGFRSAQWCHSNGLRVGKAVAQYLEEM